MVDVPMIHGGTVGPAHRRGALAIAAALICLTILCVPSVRDSLPPHLGFTPAVDAVSLLVDGLTAALLLVQSHLVRRLSMLRLGTAYLFSALITVPHLLAFPGVFAAEPVIGSGASAGWLWCAWHGGFAILVIRFALGRDDALRPGDAARSAVWTTGIVVVLTLAVTAGLPLLARSLGEGRYGLRDAVGTGPAILAVTVVAAVLVVARLRFRTVMSLWLSVALLAATLDVALTLLGGGRFSVGWYAARVQSIMTGICVLFALLSELMREAGRVANVNARLERLVRTDVLTGLANRRAFELSLLAEWRRAQREQTPLSLLMVDIDWFKGFNDRYGHPAGDDCLRAVGSILADQAFRPADIAARVGGEEFALILPVTEEAGALQVAERLRAQVAGLLVPHGGSEMGCVTVSVGAATVRPYGPVIDVSQFVRAADQALYQAKAAGRNAVQGSALAARRSLKV